MELLCYRIFHILEFLTYFGFTISFANSEGPLFSNFVRGRYVACSEAGKNMKNKKVQKRRNIRKKLPAR